MPMEADKGYLSRVKNWLLVGNTFYPYLSRLYLFPGKKSVSYHPRYNQFYTFILEANMGKLAHSG